MKNKLMDNIDLFIFDMDGILFDTETVYLEYGKKLLKELNYEVTDELVEKTTGLTNEEAKEIYLEEFGRDFPYDEITLITVAAKIPPIIHINISLFCPINTSSTNFLLNQAGTALIDEAKIDKIITAIIYFLYL